MLPTDMWLIWDKKFKPHVGEIDSIIGLPSSHSSDFLIQLLNDMNICHTIPPKCFAPRCSYSEVNPIRVQVQTYAKDGDKFFEDFAKVGVFSLSSF